MISHLKCEGEHTLVRMSVQFDSLLLNQTVVLNCFRVPSESKNFSTITCGGAGGAFESRIVRSSSGGLSSTSVRNRSDELW